MSVVNEREITEKRFVSLIEAYGGEPARWPVAEREVALRSLASSTTAQAAVAAALQLDRLLIAGPQEPVPPALETKLLADFDRVSRRWSFSKFTRAAAQTVWPGAPVWQPACAFGLALVIGFGAALAAPLDLPQSDDAAGSTFALDGASDVDAWQGI